MAVKFTNCARCGWVVPEFKYCDHCAANIAAAAPAPPRPAPAPSPPPPPLGGPMQRLREARDLHAQGKLAEAAAALDAGVIRWSASSPDTAMQAARILLRGGARGEALIREALAPADLCKVGEIAQSLDQLIREALAPADLCWKYAQAFADLGYGKEALELMRRLEGMDAQQTGLFVKLLTQQGQWESVDLKAVERSGALGFIESVSAHKGPEPALQLLQTIPSDTWAMEEYVVAARLYLALDRFDEARQLVEWIRPITAAPELFFIYAQFCEGKGRIEKAKEIYRALSKSDRQRAQAEERLKILEELPSDDYSRTASVAGSAVTHPSMLEEAAPASPGQAAAGGLIAGRFEVTGTLGVGGMGFVLKAQDRKLLRAVAVKRMRPELAADPRLRGMFIEEARTLSALSHSHIVAIYDIVESGKDVFLVMEYVDGKALARLLALRRTIPARECLRILRAVCDALGYAHEQGIWHRDLKPANILLNRKGDVKVADFGLAKRARDGAGSGQGAAGTYAYMAPEQHVGQAAAASDLFALGVTAYELLTGVLPYPADLPDLRQRKLAQQYDPLPAEVPQALRDAIHACLKGQAAARPSGAEALARALAHVQV